MGETLNGVITCDSCGALIRDVTGRHHVSGAYLGQHVEVPKSELYPVGLCKAIIACPKCPRSVPRMLNQWGNESLEWAAHVAWVHRRVRERCERERS